MSRVKIIIVLFVSLVILILLSGCGSKDPLIGTWQEPVSGITLIFTSDGKVSVGLHETAYHLQFTEQETNILVIKVSSDGTIPDITMNYTVNKDQLTLTVDGVNTLFQRVK